VNFWIAPRTTASYIQAHIRGKICVLNYNSDSESNEYKAKLYRKVGERRNKKIKVNAISYRRKG